MENLIRKYRVIHVDDDEDFLELFAFLFDKELEIVSLLSYTEVFEHLEKGDIEAVITDYEMPGIDGITLMKQIRKEYPHLPVILYTGQGNEDVAREAFVSGAADYFTKDVAGFAHKEKLINSIHKAIEKQKSEQVRMEIEEKLRRTFDDSPIGAAIMTPDLKFQRVNSELCRLSGYSEDEMLNLNFESLFYDEDLPQIRKVLNDFIEGRIDHLQVDRSHKTKDGKRGWSKISVRLIRDSEGKPLYFLPMVIDITAQKLAEIELHQSEAQKRAILDGISTNVAFVDKNLKILWANKSSAESVDKNAEEMKGKTCHSLWADPETPCILCPTVRAMKSGHIEHKIVTTPDGRVWDESGEPVYDDDGKLLGVVEIARDITTQVQLEKELIQKNQELTDFAHRVSHDLKSPVNVIKGYVEAIREEPSLIDECLDKISRGADRLREIIDNLLNLSKAGKVIGRKKDVDLCRLIKEVFDTDKPVNAKGVLYLPEEIPVIKGDRCCLYQVFDNLIQNSFKYSDPDKPEVRIKIDSHNKGNFLLLKYSDNGIGLQKEFFEKIFEPGFVIQKSKNTGFGLAIARKIINAHGGSIRVVSEGLNKGTTFFIELPISEINGIDNE